MAQLASDRPAAAQRTLLRIRKIRETLYRLLGAVVELTRLAPADVALMDRLARQERRTLELVNRGSSYELRRSDDNSSLDCIIWPVVASAVEFLTSSETERLKRCGECDWMFVDDSKNRSRLWCKKECGDRVRARRHYALHHHRSSF